MRRAINRKDRVAISSHAHADSSPYHLAIEREVTLEVELLQRFKPWELGYSHPHLDVSYWRSRATPPSKAWVRKLRWSLAACSAHVVELGEQILH